DARIHAEEDRQTAEFLRIRGRLENMLEANEKSFAEFGLMLDEEKQRIVKKILEGARRALSSSNLEEGNRSLGKGGEAAQILTDVILYDPSMLSRETPVHSAPAETEEKGTPETR